MTGYLAKEKENQYTPAYLSTLEQNILVSSYFKL